MLTSTRRRIGALFAAAACATGALAGLTAQAGAATGSTYVKAVPVCAAPKVNHATCFAWKQVRVSKSTAGARPMAARPAYTTGPAGGYTPADLASAYGVNPDTATSQVVGIVDAYDDPNALVDLNAFDAQYGLPAETATSFKKVGQTGSATTLPVSNSGWAGEESLDLDAVRGLCHKCRIVLVEANSNANTDLAASVNEAVTLGATVVSNSYGGSESGTLPTSYANAYKHPGVVITASTGDDGMFAWDNYNGGGTSANTPELPSSLNTVVAVGGTTLYLNADGTRSGESVWNENGPYDVTGNFAFGQGRPMGASGGGCSTEVTAQGWQKAVANYAQTGCGSNRLAGDVAALADPYTGYDILDTFPSGGWQTFGGTSLASPLIAAMWAMAGGSGGVNYPALSLYGHFKSDSTHPLYDVTTGGNAFCAGTPATECKAYWGQSPNTFGAGTLDCAFKPNSNALSTGALACDAATGWDGPSGVGTPTGLAAFTPMKPTAKITVPGTVTHGVSASFSGSTSTDPFPGGTFTSYAWTWGDGTTTAATTAATSHKYTTAGTYSVKLTVTDKYGQTGSTTVSVTVH
jgi:subtilase family serine protease